MTRKSRRFTENDLSKIKLSTIKPKIIKIKTTSTSPTKIYKKNYIQLINNFNNNSIITTSYSENHFSIVFDGARLLSLNNMFSLLEFKKLKYSLFNYKKNWHTIVKNELLKIKNCNLPFFDSSVEVTLLRRAKRTVDQDSLPPMFKYIIDALKYNKELNPNGILKEDNINIISNLKCYNLKGSYLIGIKIAKTNNLIDESFNPYDLL